MSTITYIPIDADSGDIRARGHQFRTHADAYIASLTDGAGTLERDIDGYMRAVEDGKQIYMGGSFHSDDGTAKDQVVLEIGRHLNTGDFRYTVLKIERDASKKIVKIDDQEDPEQIDYWARRIA